MTDTSDDSLCLVFIPALITVLYAAEKRKGAPLTEKEVIDIRDKGRRQKLSATPDLSGTVLPPQF